MQAADNCNIYEKKEARHMLTDELRLNSIRANDNEVKLVGFVGEHRLHRNSFIDRFFCRQLFF